MKIPQALTGVVLVAAVVVVSRAGAQPPTEQPLAAQCTPATAPAEIQAEIGRKQPVTQKDCYAQVHGKIAIPEAIKITAHLDYGKDGAMLSVSTTASSFTSGARALDLCVAGAVRGWALPCGPNKVDVPFEFPRD
jgi:hypothetical protein